MSDKNKNNKQNKQGDQPVAEKLAQLRHSAAHLLAAAVMELRPDAKPTIGPAIETGFYYDFEFSETFSEEELPAIEAKMHELVASWSGFERQEVSADEALKKYEQNQYKQELIREFAGEGEKISLYQSGEFVDLCRGGHTENPSAELKHFKLMSVAGAYWRGDEKNTMLTRIYGTAFFSKEDLDAHLKQIEEAEKRDHRKLGQELDLFVFSDLVGKGLPLFTPKGALLRELLNDFSQGLRAEKGFSKVWVPHLTKNDLYKTSGHWDKFGDELFLVESQETSDELVLKPMNCPHHQQIFASRQRSYRDLPIKYMETTTIYRDEKAGELLGLSRVRSITQDDAHIFCTPDQIEEIFAELTEISQKFFDKLGMEYRARLSYWDPQAQEKYLGEPELWEKSQGIIRDLAENSGLDYFEAEGEAAFYGPKIDFMVRDALGREWQLATQQLDFVQPERFGLKYVDMDGEEKTPVMVHYALMGSLERFLSVYIEHTAGKFPVWLAPVQAKILPITDDQLEYAGQVLNQLKVAGIRAEVDDRSATLSAKIRDAQMEKLPYMLVIGGREAEAGQVAVRSRDDDKQQVITVDEFLKKVETEVQEKS